MTDETTQEPFVVPRMTDEELEQFVRDFVCDRLFTSFHLPLDDSHALPRVFLTIALSPLSSMPPEQLEQIGCLWQHMSEAAPLSIGSSAGGMLPTFWSFRIMHVDDWNRVQPTILKQTKALADVELAPNGMEGEP